MLRRYNRKSVEVGIFRSRWFTLSTNLYYSSKSVRRALLSELFKVVSNGKGSCVVATPSMVKGGYKPPNVA